MTDFCDPRLLAWYMEQCQANPHGIIPIGVAAQICGCTRQGIRHACTRGKIRLLAWRWKPRRLYFVPVLDLIQWQAQRPGMQLKVDTSWGTYLNSRIAIKDSDLDRVGPYVMCRKCHRVKSVRALKMGDDGMRTPVKLASRQKRERWAVAPKAEQDRSGEQVGDVDESTSANQ